MKQVFAGSFIALLVWSAVAWHMQPAPPDGRVPLVWMTGDNPTCRRQAELFNASQDRYRVAIDPQPANMAKTMVQCVAGVGPDLFDCWFPSHLQAYVRAGVAADATEPLAARGIGSEGFWPAVRAHYEAGGRLYGHPTNATADAVWYNKRLFREAGVPFPEGDWTWPECIAIAKRLARRDAQGRPLQFGLLFDREMWRLVFVPQWGGRVYAEGGTRCVIDSPEAIAGMQQYQDLMFREAVSPTAADENSLAGAGGYGTDTIMLFGGGRGAMAIGGRWWLCVLRDESFRGLELGVAPLPRGPGGRPYGGGRATLINRATEHFEGAVEFLAFMSTPEYDVLINRETDALGPSKRYYYGEYERRFLDDPARPQDRYNAVWRAALEQAAPDPPSPFMPGEREQFILTMAVDAVRERSRPVAEIMGDAARSLNRIIVEQLRLDPALRARYDALVAGGAPRAWDAPEDAP